MFRQVAHNWRESTQRGRLRLVVTLVAGAITVGGFLLAMLEIEVSLGYPWARILAASPIILVAIVAADQTLEQWQTRHLDPPEEWFPERQD